MKKILLFLLIPFLLWGQARNTITNDGTKNSLWYMGMDPNAKASIGIPHHLPLMNTFTLSNGGTMGSYTFLPGWDGTGWKLSYENNEYTLTVDNLDIRGVFSAREFLINQLQVNNGNLLVSSAAKVESVVANTPVPYFIVEDVTKHGIAPFQVGDIIQCQVINSSAQTYDAQGNVATNRYLMKRLTYRVAGVSGLKVYYAPLANAPTNTGIIESGDYFVRLGNTTNTDRQGLVGIYSDEQYSPYIRITDGVDSWTSYKNFNKVKVQLGRLVFNDSTFGAIDTYGLYALGDIYLKNGSITLDDSGYVRAGKLNYSDDTEGFFIGNDGGTPKINIGTASNYLKWTGDSLLIGAHVVLNNQSSILISGFDNDAGYITGASSGNKTFYQATAPTIADSVKVGDFWFDTGSVNYLLKRCSAISPSVTWDPVGVYMDATGIYTGNLTAGQITSGVLGIARIPQSDIRTDSLNNAGNLIRTYYQGSTPTGQAIGDIWVNTDSLNTMYRWTGSAWTEIIGPGTGLGVWIDGTGIYTGSLTAGQITTGVLNIGRIPQSQISTDSLNNSGNFVRTYYQSTAPSDPHEGDIWINSDSLNTIYRYSGGWSELIGPGSGIGTLITATGIYTGSVTANQVTAGTLTGFTILTNASPNTRIDMSGSSITFYHSSTGGGTTPVGSMSPTFGAAYGVTFSGGFNADNLYSGGSPVVTGTPWTGMGYLTSESDPTIYAWAKDATKPSYTYSEVGAAASSHGHYLSDVTQNPGGGDGIVIVSSGSLSTTSNNSSNWDTAYGWGNHASAGYVTGTPWTSMGYLTSEVDGSTTNEIQTLGTSGNTITLTSGGSVTAPYATSAGSVTNGVYTTGSYSNPSWITSLDYSKLTAGGGGSGLIRMTAGSPSLETASYSVVSMGSESYWSTVGGIKFYTRTITIDGTGYTVITSAQEP